MLITLDELISQVLQEEADEVCTPEIRDNMWKNISAYIDSCKEDTKWGKNER